jgi:lysophospholipase L1-like esterase
MISSSRTHTPRLLVRVYGDSLSLPRFSDGIMCYQTYPELFCESLRISEPEILISLYNRSKQAATAPALAADCQQDYSYFGPTESQIIIIQCGICDCAPRPLPPWIRRQLAKLPTLFSAPIVRFLHNNRSRLLKRGCSWCEVAPETFRSVMRQWLTHVVPAAERVLVINIAPTLSHTEEHSPGLSASIQAYNRLIAEAVSSVPAPNVDLIDTYREILTCPGGVESCINSKDGHHITAAGHRLYSRLLVSAVKQRSLTAKIGNPA